MAKLVMFLLLIVGFIFTLSFNVLKGDRPSNQRFDLATIEKQHHEKMAEKEKLELAALSGQEGASADGAAEGEEAAAENKPGAETIVLDTEELKNGHSVYTSKGQCLVCHGKNGEGKKSQQAPAVAGQYDWYLYAQLVNMKNKVRVNKKMEPYLTKLSDQDMKDVSLYISKMPSF